jgi:aminopeptidase-like protein
MTGFTSYESSDANLKYLSTHDHMTVLWPMLTMIRALGALSVSLQVSLQLGKPGLRVRTISIHAQDLSDTGVTVCMPPHHYG